MTDRHDIQRMLDRFMAGTTTEAEERLLTDYFCEAVDLPAEWEAYAVMFRGFRQQAASSNHHAKIVPMKRWLSVAASVLVIFGLSWYYLKSLEPKADIPAKVAKPMAIVTPKVEQTHVELPEKNTEVGQKSKLQKPKRKRIAKKVERLVAVAEEPSEPSLLDIDMEAVQQQGEDLRLAMAIMNQELLETN